MKILCVGGGTLGSVVPLLAIIEELKYRQSDLTVLWWGTKNGPEKALLVAEGMVFKSVSAGKFRRYFSWRNFFDLGCIVAGLFQSLWRFRQNRPDCLLTAASYAAVPVAWAAYFYGIPVLAHQQDIRPSLANKLIAPVAKKITVALPASLTDFAASKATLVGNPVRKVFLDPPSKESARNKLGLAATQTTILIMGGGTGATFLNDLIASIKDELIKIAQVIHITGAGKKTAVSSVGYKVINQTNESITLLAAADVVVTRAGMGALTELGALSKAAIVVPIPKSHQEDNARYFADKGSVILLPQAQLTAQHLLATVKQLLADSETRDNLGRRLNDLWPAGAAAKIADIVVEMINNK